MDTMLKSMLTAMCAGLLTFTALLGSVRYAQAYYGSTYDYYLRDASSQKAFIQVSGVWDYWYQDESLINAGVRLQTDVISTAYSFYCWYSEISGTVSGINTWNGYDADPLVPGAQRFTYNTTPFDSNYQSLPQAIVGLGNARYGGGMTSSGSGCSAGLLGTMAFNSFNIPWKTNSNNQGDLWYSTSFP